MITTVALYIFLFVISVFLEQKFRILLKLKYFLAYTYVWILKRRTPPIFDFQYKCKDLKKFGITSLPEAWFRERPRALQPNIHASDTHVFYGVHKDGSVLVARITRRHNRIADTWVYLRLPSGEQYELPNHPDTKIYNVCDNKFSAGGLTFELLEPLRRWRVIFNGYLRKKRSCAEWDNSDNDTVHISFNFIWRPMYNYVAFPQDFNCSFLTEIMCSRPWRKGLINPNEFFSEETFSIHGHMIGEVKIENQKEIVLQLRGIKDRKHGVFDWNEIESKLIIQGTLDNGVGFYIIAENNNVTRLSYLYGYVLPPSNYVVHHVDTFSVKPEELLSEKRPNKLSFQFSSRKKNFLLNATCDEDGFIVREGNHWTKEISIHPIKVTLNNKEGRGIIKHVTAYHGQCTAPVQQSLPLLREPVIAETDAFVVSFMDIECRSSKVVGGKGASLANMLSMPNNMFRVPLGVCLTRTAFEIHLHDNPSIMEAILRMQNIAWQRSPGCLPDECERVVTTIKKEATIPENVKNQLQQKLISVFGEDYAKIQFAVRSSAIGEDGDEMSAAGQNETFLGIIGFNNICSNILKCWASQFAYRSVEYKRQNGQLLNSGMGVVIQAMVPADVSGVLFSRDPLTGSRTSMLISSNFGLGESVVSASADPDSITLKRSWNDKLTVLKKQLGSKKHMIMMAEEGGTVESEVDKDKASTLTISDKLAIKLGQISIFQEQCFGNPRDIEWAIQGNHIFLLQSRPVTVDNIVPDLEIMHEFDTSPRTDNERGSTANVGEVIPGALSPLGFSSLIRTMACQSMDLLTWKLKTHRFDPIVLDGWMFHYGHCFFDLIHQKTWSLRKKGTIDKAADIGLFGRVLDDDDVLELAMERFEDPPLKSKLTLARFAFKGLLFGHWVLKNLVEAFESCPDPTTGIKSIKNTYEAVGNHMLQQFTAFDSHMSISIGSSLWNVLVLNLLPNDSQDYTIDQYTDFAKIIGSGIGAESGDVPNSFQKLAKQIAKEIDPKKFISFSSAHALQWIQESSKNSGVEFKKFLDRHGHRGVKECDVMSVTWALNPIGVVKILQDILRLPEKGSALNKDGDELSGLKTHLTPFKRFLLKLVMKGSRLGVCQREKAKSMLISYIHSLRLGYRHLAALMVTEGYITDPSLLFFFTHEEIEQFMNTRSANLLRRIKHRSRLFSKMDDMKFPEMIIGFPVPIGNEDEIVDEITDSVTGYPVSQGVVKGPAKVVKTFHEIGTIQPGDILITTATDIGWSPYFPMLSGVVTEIGGLISHGAVVAREFGLPCIVGAQRATKIFKTGDAVILDATKGVLSKVHSATSQVA